MRSPVMAASFPCERIATLTCPGECPGVEKSANLVGQPMIRLDQLLQPCIDDRED